MGGRSHGWAAGPTDGRQVPRMGGEEGGTCEVVKANGVFWAPHALLKSMGRGAEDRGVGHPSPPSLGVSEDRMCSIGVPGGRLFQSGQLRFWFFVNLLSIA